MAVAVSRVDQRSSPHDAAGTSERSSAPASFYLPSLDGIRALAVGWVFLAHAGLAEWGIPGNLGVTVFFFLSGYLITTLLRIELERTGGVNLTAFYLRRSLRIFPPMYIVLAVASILCFAGVIEGSLAPDAVLAQLLHLTNYYIVAEGWWTGRAPGTWVYWSLAVEEHFYLVFPVFYLALLRLLPSRSRQALTLVGLCGVVLAWRLVLVWWLGADKDRTYVATDTRVDSILFGCILAIYGNPALDATRITGRWLKTLLVPLGILGLLVSIAIRNPQFQETWRYTLQGLALFPLFIVAVRYPEWGPCRLLNVRWVRFVGSLSYSLYLMHTTVIFGVLTWTTWHPVLQGVVSLGLSLALATAMLYAVERPCAALRKRLSRIERRGGLGHPTAGPDQPPTAPAPAPSTA
jgi:peptidoglycan/LPS O-acetylase OafA/YrhL